LMTTRMISTAPTGCNVILQLVWSQAKTCGMCGHLIDEMGSPRQRIIARQSWEWACLLCYPWLSKHQ